MTDVKKVFVDICQHFYIHSVSGGLHVLLVLKTAGAQGWIRHELLVQKIIEFLKLWIWYLKLDF